MYTLYTIPGSCSSGITVLPEKLGLKKKGTVPFFS